MNNSQLMKFNNTNRIFFTINKLFLNIVNLLPKEEEVKKGVKKDSFH